MSRNTRLLQDVYRSQVQKTEVLQMLKMPESSINSYRRPMPAKKPSYQSSSCGATQYRNLDPTIKKSIAIHPCPGIFGKGRKQIGCCLRSPAVTRYSKTASVDDMPPECFIGRLRDQVSRSAEREF